MAGEDESGRPKRRRRRRGKKVAADGASAQGKAPVKSETKSETKSPRNRRGRKRSGERGSGPGGGQAPDGSRRRNRGRRRNEEQSNTPQTDTAERIESSRPKRRRPSTGPNLTEVDLGWDDEPIALPPELNAHAVARRRQPADSAIDRIAWGDDSKAPTPDVTLPRIRPVEVPDTDPDPVTFGTLGTLDRSVGVESAKHLDNPVAIIAGVSFATAGKIYQFDAGNGSYHRGDTVSVEGDRTNRNGSIAQVPRLSPVTRPLKKILRKARAGRGPSAEAAGARGQLMETAKACARSLDMKVKIFRVEPPGTGQRGKTVVYFSSEKKLEQRQLARELAKQLGSRVELRQTGVRDEAKIIGGIGSCGLELCCSTWLPAFVPVSIKNAKDQGLVLNPSKVSGQCGRLKCCLVYEQATYAEARKGLPKLGKRVYTKDDDGNSGDGRVVEVDVLHRRIRVSHGEGRFEVYKADQVEPMFPSQPQGKPRPDAKLVKLKGRSSGGDDRAKADASSGSKDSGDGDGRKRRRRRSKGGDAESVAQSTGTGGSNPSPSMDIPASPKAGEAGDSKKMPDPIGSGDSAADSIKTKTD